MGRPRLNRLDLPRRVYERRGLYYFSRPGDGKWVPLGADRKLAIETAITLGCGSTPEPKVPREYLAHIWRSCQKNARARDQQIAITDDDVEALWVRANGRCELTGVPFSLLKRPGWRKRPYAPSIDRIDNGAGYTRDNCRLVCVAANVALNEWGEAVLVTLAHGMMMKKRKYWTISRGLDADAILLDEKQGKS